MQKDYFFGLEDRIKKLEESFVSVKGDVDGLISRAEKGINVGDVGEGENERRTVPIPTLIGTEDSVDAMGAVTFADEEDSGFFGTFEIFALSSCPFTNLAGGIK